MEYTALWRTYCVSDTTKCFVRLYLTCVASLPDSAAITPTMQVKRHRLREVK